jgi:hypothetical protein
MTIDQGALLIILVLWLEYFDEVAAFTDSVTSCLI